jgi:Lhr-like helicase
LTREHECAEPDTPDDGRSPSSTIFIGDVDHAWAEDLQPGDRFLLDGRCLEMRRLEAGSLLVDEVAGRPAAPRWASEGWPLSPELAQRLYLMRIRAAEALRDSPTALAELLQREYGLLGEVAAVLTEYFERQEALSEIPDYDGILVEAIGDGAAFELYVHTPLNRLANDALARVAVHRLARDRRRAADSVVADLGFALFVRGGLKTSVPELLRSLLDANEFTGDLDSALADRPSLRECFRRVATTGLMLLRNTSKRQRKVGGRAWGERQLFDRVRVHDPQFVLLRQVLREVRGELCDAMAALRFAATLQYRPIRCRFLRQPSPFAESWTQSAPGPSEDMESPARALKRLHAILTNKGA